MESRAVHDQWPVRLLIVLAGAILGVFGVATRLLGVSVLGALGLSLGSLIAAPLLVSLVKLLWKSETPLVKPSPLRFLLAVIGAGGGALVAAHTLPVVEPVLMYRSSFSLPEDTEFHVDFRTMLNCGDRLYAFGDRTVLKDSTVQYRDAVSWYMDNGSWAQTRSEVGIGQLRFPGNASQRAFYGGLCNDEAVIAFGTDTWTSAEVGSEPDGALWQQEGDGWKRLETNAELAGEGTQRVLGVFRRPIEPPVQGKASTSSTQKSLLTRYLLVLGLGEAEGARCLSSADFVTWENVSGTVIDGWQVDSTFSDGRRFFALGHRFLKDPSRTRESAIFSSSTCRSWSQEALPKGFRFNSILRSISGLSGKLVLSGWTTWTKDKPSRALMAAGTTIDSLRPLDLSELGDEEHRGFYAVGALGEELVALGYDNSAPSIDGESGRVIVVPIMLRRVKAIRTPLGGISYGPRHSNVTLDT